MCKIAAKARNGGLAGLLDPAVMNRKREAEKKLQGEISRLPGGSEILSAWAKIAEATKTRAAHLQGGSPCSKPASASSAPISKRPER